MRKITKANRGSRGKRREWMMNVGLIAYLIGLALRIPLSRMIGDKGMGFYAGALELYILLSVVFSYGVSRALAALVKYRVRREMFKSVKRVYRNVMIFTMAAGALLTVGTGLFSRFLSQTVLLEERASMAVLAIAPAVFLSAVTGVMRGYFQGMGSMLPTVHSRMLEKVMQFGGSLLFGAALYAYGEKVAALKKSSEFAPAYGAMGAALGVSVACFFCLLHLLFLRMVYAGTFKQQLMRDNTKYAESNAQIFLTFFQTSLPHILCALLYNMNYVVDQRIFNYAMNVKEKGDLRAAHWGIYYGKYSTVIGIAAVVCACVAAVGTPRIVQLQEKQETREAQFRFGNLMHYVAIFTIPCAVWLAVLAEPIVGVLFTGDTETAVSLIRSGSVLIVLFPFAYQRYVIFGGLGAFLLHLLVLFVLVSATDAGIHAVVWGMAIFWLAVCAAGYLGIMRYLSYTPDWIRFFVIPAACAGVSGLVALLLCKLLMGLIGKALTLVICLVLCIVIYNVLLVLLKGVREDELREMPAGGILLRLWERVNLI